MSEAGTAGYRSVDPGILDAADQLVAILTCVLDTTDHERPPGERIDLRPLLGQLAALPGVRITQGAFVVAWELLLRTHEQHGDDRGQALRDVAVRIGTVRTAYEQQDGTS